MFRTLRVIIVVLTGAVLRSAGQQAAIESVAENVGVVFRTPTNGSVHHCYRVEAATSLVSAAWTPVRTIVGCDAKQAVTNAVSLTGASAFYRVVATSNSAEFVDGSYLAIDVSGGSSVTSYPVAYYDRASAVPGGITDVVYKTTSILMRFAPRGMFKMGSPTSEIGHGYHETQHTVTFTKDFYIGVFEVTQKQWERVMGTWPSYFTNPVYRESRPVEQVSYYEIRENPANSAITPKWPHSDQVHSDSFVGKLRAKTGLPTLDLPTESQWEYACRAGTTAALNSGYDLTNLDSDSRMSVVGRYDYNRAAGYSPESDLSQGSAKVGGYLPNAWGLYDFHGNAWEWCLDWYGPYPGNVQDPPGPGTGVNGYRVRRGGGWEDLARFCRSAEDGSSYPSFQELSVGFRIARTLQ